jgi:hypothetical protein
MQMAGKPKSMSQIKQSAIPVRFVPSISELIVLLISVQTVPQDS